MIGGLRRVLMSGAPMALLRRPHVERAVALVFKAVGLKRGHRLAAALAWRGARFKMMRLRHQAA